MQITRPNDPGALVPHYDHETGQTYYTTQGSTDAYTNYLEELRNRYLAGEDLTQEQYTDLGWAEGKNFSLPYSNGLLHGSNYYESGIAIPSYDKINDPNLRTQLSSFYNDANAYRAARSSSNDKNDFYDALKVAGAMYLAGSAATGAWGGAGGSEGVSGAAGASSPSGFSAPSISASESVAGLGGSYAPATAGYTSAGGFAAPSISAADSVAGLGGSMSPATSVSGGGWLSGLSSSNVLQGLNSAGGLLGGGGGSGGVGSPLSFGNNQKQYNNQGLLAEIARQKALMTPNKRLEDLGLLGYG